MKKAKKLKRKLASRIRDWENMTQSGKKDAKAYRKPGSQK